MSRSPQSVTPGLPSDFSKASTAKMGAVALTTKLHENTLEWPSVVTIERRHLAPTRFSKPAGIIAVVEGDEILEMLQIPFGGTSLKPWRQVDRNSNAFRTSKKMGSSFDKPIFALNFCRL